MPTYVGCRYIHAMFSKPEVWLLQVEGPSTYDIFATPEGKKSPCARLFCGGADIRVVKRMCAIWAADPTAVPDYNAIEREIRISANDPVMLDEVRSGMTVRIQHNHGTQAAAVESVFQNGDSTFIEYDTGTCRDKLSVVWVSERLETNMALVELNRAHSGGQIGVEETPGRAGKWIPTFGHRVLAPVSVLSILTTEASQEEKPLTLAVYGWMPDDPRGYPRIGERGHVLGTFRMWRDAGVLHIYKKTEPESGSVSNF